MTVLAGMALCFSAGICLGSCGLWVFLLAMIAALAWQNNSNQIWPKPSSSWTQWTPWLPWTLGTTMLVAASFLWGVTNHGDFRPAEEGRHQILATGTRFSWRGGTVLIESSSVGAAGASPPKLITLQKVDASLRAGLWIDPQRCAPGKWLAPGRCVLAVDPVAMRPSGVAAKIRMEILAARKRAIHYLNLFGPFAAIWLKALLLGISSNERGGLLDSFRGIGLLHFLVVSGAHVTLVNRVTSKLIFFLINLAHGLCPRLPPLRSRPSLLILMVPPVVTVWFCLLAGLDPPVQRALCSLFVVQLGTMAGLKTSRGAMITSTFVLQGLIWPVGFVSRSNFLSWMAWLIVLLAKPSVAGGVVLQTAVQACVRQVAMTMSLAAVMGLTGCAGIMANLLFLPVLEWLFFLSLAVVAGGPALAAAVGFEPLIQGVCHWASWMSGLAAGGILWHIDEALTRPWIRVGIMTMAWFGLCRYATSTLVFSKISSPPLPEVTVE